MFYRHTKKAIRSGAPSDRVFAVVGKETDEGREYLLAWKHIEDRVGFLQHPGYGYESMPVDDPRLFELQSGGSEPTALFVPDSFYERCYQ